MSLALRIVTAYDPDHADRFRRWRRARWSEDLAGFTGSAAQLGVAETWMFGVRATASRRRWALTLERGRRRYAAILVAPRITCAEEVAAEALAAIAADGGPKVARVLAHGRLDRDAFERFWAATKARGKAAESVGKGKAAAPAPVPAPIAAAAAAAGATPAVPRLERRLHAVPRMPMPADVVRLCSGVGYFDAIGLGVDYYIERTDDADVLWQAVEEMEPFPLGEVEIAGDLATGGLRLIEAALQANCLAAFGAGTLRGGLVSAAQVEAAWQRKRDERARMVALAASDADYPILVAARELGLEPRPSGTGPWSWYARCPGTKHEILVQAKNGEFGCGYCRRRGGVEELQAFAGERQPIQK